MAARKAVPEARATFTMDIEAADLKRPRMRIVTPLGEYQKMRPKMFDTGDIVIGAAPDDREAALMYEVADPAHHGVLVHVLNMSKHLGANKDDEGNNIDFTTYEIGDPAAPKAAKLIHEFVLLVPEYDTFMPVMAAFTPGSRGASSAICMAIAVAQRNGNDARKLAFRLSTTPKTSGPHTWDAYTAVAVEPAEEHQALAIEIGDQLVAPPSRQIAVGAEAAAF